MALANILVPNVYELYVNQSSSSIVNYYGNSPNFLVGGVLNSTIPGGTTGNVCFQVNKVNGDCTYNAMTGLLTITKAGSLLFVMSYIGSTSTSTSGTLTLNVLQGTNSVATTVVSYPSATFPGTQGSVSLNCTIEAAQNDGIVVTFSNSGGGLIPVANGFTCTVTSI